MISDFNSAIQNPHSAIFKLVLGNFEAGVLDLVPALI